MASGTGVPNQKAVLISLKPEYFELIRRGEKTIELRRKFPNLSAGTIAVIYASAPLSAVVGFMRVEGMLCATPQELWAEVADRAGISLEKYEKYYSGAREARGLMVEGLCPVHPISLARLRAIWPTFCPPQSFRYLNVRRESDDLLLGLPEKDSWLKITEAWSV